MLRPAHLALALSLAALGCGQEKQPLVLDRSAGLAVTGSPVAVFAALDPSCTEWTTLTVGLASGAPLPAWLAASAEALLSDRPNCFFVSNPGSTPPFDTGGSMPAPAPAVVPAPGCLAGYMLTFLAGAGAPAGPHELQVSVVGCGQSGRARYRLQVVGAVERPGMCGWSSGGACGSNDGCRRVGFHGLLCAEAGAAAPIGEPLTLACADPVVTGASCGCVAGTCAWH